MIFHEFYQKANFFLKCKRCLNLKIKIRFPALCDLELVDATLEVFASWKWVRKSRQIVAEKQQNQYISHDPITRARRELGL